MMATCKSEGHHWVSEHIPYFKIWIVQCSICHTYNHEEMNQQLSTYTNREVAETVQRNRIELAKDIKHRHWVNDGLRNAYLDAVVEVAKEQLEHIKNGDWQVTNSNTGETHWEKKP